MVLAFCRRGSVIPICLYLLVGRYMKFSCALYKEGCFSCPSKQTRAIKEAKLLPSPHIFREFMFPNSGASNKIVGFISSLLFSLLFSLLLSLLLYAVRCRKPGLSGLSIRSLSLTRLCATYSRYLEVVLKVFRSKVLVADHPLFRYPRYFAFIIKTDRSLGRTRTDVCRFSLSKPNLRSLIIWLSLPRVIELFGSVPRSTPKELPFSWSTFFSKLLFQVFQDHFR